MLYAIIAAVVLAILCGWLIWRHVALREALEREKARARSLQRDRAIRQNLQNVLERREQEIRRLRERIAGFESDFQEMENRASDLNVSLFRESGLRILAEKEDGAKRLKMEQLEQQLESARRKLRQRQEEAAEAEQRYKGRIGELEQEVARLRQTGARRMRHAATAQALTDQVTLDDILKTED